MDIKRLQQVASDYCRYIRNGDERAINSVSEFYKLGKESPSTARVILLDEQRKSMQYLESRLEPDTLELGGKQAFENYSKAIDNITEFSRKVDRDKSVKPLLGKYASSFREKYPLTHQLRMKLIDNGRVRMDKVMPKMGLWEKFKNWRGSVPKEFSQMLKKAIK